MTQNEQNVRTRDTQITDLGSRIFVGMRNHTDSMCEAQRHIDEAEARGAAEQRQKDAEGQEPSAYVKPIDLYDEEDYERSGIWSDTKEGEYTLPLYTRPANLAALEVEIAALKEAEQLARADAEASKARVEALEAEVTALKSKSDDPDDVTCALMDSQYVAGAKFGWNCSQDDDHTRLSAMIEGRLRDRIEAGVSFSKRSQDVRAALTREGGV